VATAAGMFLALCWPAAVCAILLFLLVVVFSRFVSLGSIAAAAAMPLLIYLLWVPHFSPHLAPPASVTIGAFAAAMLVVYKHDGNIQRLVEGREPRFAFSKESKDRDAE
jgi:glycerol-3-phosphate acyltransferase PlsY